ncbi:hypothetical protein [Streptomyces sp. NPDC085540]|uniref:hypothetical protein n=1 Tax=Streptomyces sp. NPDC085540 TaxID=3365730 RepID=UPI0037D01323
MNSSLIEVLVTTAVTRPPAEIAALVAALHARGHTAVAARMVQEAAAIRSVDDITALALALLDTNPATTAGPAAVPRQPPPPGVSPPAVGPDPGVWAGPASGPLRGLLLDIDDD